MARQIEVNLISDSKDFQKSMQVAGDSAKEFTGKVDDTGKKLRDFDGGLRNTEDRLGGATDKFRSTGDLAGGLATVFGVSLGPMEQYAMGLADMADGLGGLLAPALTKAKGAMRALNTTMRANPILTVITVLTLLVGAFVLAWKNSETFREIVKGTWRAIKNAFAVAWEFIRDVFNRIIEKFGWVKKFFGIYVDVIKGYLGAWWGTAEKAWRIISNVFGKIKDGARGVRNVFSGIVDGIKGLWNNSLGGLTIGLPKVSIPLAPDFPGFSFTIPELAKGGIARAGMPHIVGERGPELFVPGMTGTVVPNNKLGGGTVRVVIDVQGADSEMKKAIRKMVRLDGGNVQRAFGTA